MSREYIDVIRDIYDEARVDRETGYYDRISFDLPRLPEVILGKFDWAPVKLLKDGFEKAILKEFDIGYDKDLQRITFPIRDHYGNLVGISGRNKRGVYPRYKIYRKELHDVVPGYEFKKGATVWGLDRFYATAMTIGVDSPIIVCEGFKAAIWVVQHGFDNTVALIGDHLSEEQKLLLSRITNEIVLFLDNDSAGRKATFRAIKKLKGGLEVRVARYAENHFGKSPDDLTKNQIENAVNNSMNRFEWMKQYIRR